MDNQQFFKNVYPEPNTGCWLWAGSHNADGYGRFFYDKTAKTAHRASYKIHKGDIVGKLYVLHTCDNSACVNPDHLFLGTLQDNIRDKYQKGRQAKGVKCGKNVKLNDGLALMIRDKHSKGLMTINELADLLRVSDETIRMVIVRKSWKHL